MESLPKRDRICAAELAEVVAPDFAPQQWSYTNPVEPSRVKRQLIQGSEDVTASPDKKLVAKTGTGQSCLTHESLSTMFAACYGEFIVIDRQRVLAK